MQPLRRLTLAVTSACNCRCKMCSIWEQQGSAVLSFDQYRDIFRSHALCNVTDLSLTGGEPTLRKDLADIVALAVSSFPRLIKLSLNSNGFASALLEDQVKNILAVVGDRCQLSVGLSFDGIDVVHDRVRGVKGVFVRLVDSIARLESLRKAGFVFGLSLRCTITKDNAHQIMEIDRYCCGNGWPIIFAVASDPDAYINADVKRDQFALDQEQLESSRAFFLEKAASSAYYARAANFLLNKRRTFGCIGAQGMTALILPNGDVLPCGERENLLLGNLNHSNFDDIWSADHTREVFSSMRQDACSSCPSQCYPTEWRLLDNFNPLLKSLLPSPIIKSVRKLKFKTRSGKR